jgi:hypothetical protein
MFTGELAARNYASVSGRPSSRSAANRPPTGDAMRERWSIVGTICGVLAALLSAAAMRDHVRVVEIVSLFASGVATGASITALLVGRGRAATRPAVERV